MTISYTKENDASAIIGTSPLTFTGETMAAGTFQVLFVANSPTNKVLTAVADDAGNTWNVDVTATGSSGVSIASSLLTNAVTPSTTFTFTFNVSTSTTVLFWFEEIAGTSGVVDKTQSGTGTGTAAATAATATLSNANSIAVALFCANGTTTYTKDAAFLNFTTPTISRGFVEYQIVASATGLAATATLGTSRTWVGVIATYPAAALPVNTAAPTAYGAPAVGAEMLSSTGTWTGSPTSYGYQWKSSAHGAGVFSTIVGATSSRYTAVLADLGRDFQCAVTATSPAGTAAATASNTLGPAVAASSNWLYETAWGTQGNGNGQFQACSNVVSNAAGTRVYLCDDLRNDVQAFDANGNWLFTFGGPVTGFLAGLSDPLSICVGPGVEDVYVIQHVSPYGFVQYDKDGTFIRKVLATGSGNGQFRNASLIRAAADGTLYVYDYTRLDIQTFTAAGVFIAVWKTIDLGNNSFDVSRNDNTIWTVDATFHLKQWDSTGTQLASLGVIPNVGPGAFASVNLAVKNAASYKLFMTMLDGSSPAEDDIRVYDQALAAVETIGVRGSGDGQFIDPDTSWRVGGKMFVADKGNYRIQRWTEVLYPLTPVTPTSLSLGTPSPSSLTLTPVVPQT